MHTRHLRSSFRVGRQRWRRVGGLLSSRRMAKGSSARVTRRGNYDFTALALGISASSFSSPLGLEIRASAGRHTESKTPDVLSRAQLAAHFRHAELGRDGTSLHRRRLMRPMVIGPYDTLQLSPTA